MTLWSTDFAARWQRARMWSYGRRLGRYRPHQGDQEKARRRRQRDRQLAVFINDSVRRGVLRPDEGLRDWVRAHMGLPHLGERKDQR